MLDTRFVLFLSAVVTLGGLAGVQVDNPSNFGVGDLESMDDLLLVDYEVLPVVGGELGCGSVAIYSVTLNLNLINTGSVQAGGVAEVTFEDEQGNEFYRRVVFFSVPPGGKTERVTVKMSFGVDVGERLQAPIIDTFVRFPAKELIDTTDKVPLLKAILLQLGMRDLDVALGQAEAVGEDVEEGE